MIMGFRRPTYLCTQQLRTLSVSAFRAGLSQPRQGGPQQRRRPRPPAGAPVRPRPPLVTRWLALLGTDQSLRQIADQVGRAVLRLAQRFVDRDTQRPSHQRPKLSDAEQQAALGLLASGMSLRAVAKQFDVSYASIDRIQRRYRRQQTSQAPLDGSTADAANGPAEPEG